MEEKEFKEWLEQQRRSLDLFLDPDGQWWHDGAPFTHRGITRSFNRGIRRHDESGEPIIRIGSTWCYFKSAGSPFIVKRIVSRENAISGYWLNTEQTLLTENAHPFYIDDHVYLKTLHVGVVRFDRASGIERGHGRAGDHRLRLADVLRAEEELPVQV